ncbi:peptide-methionine (S)-S-oxide reductase MsrA [Pelagibacterium sp. 26DY04]|uniref:peptide-methionine (S)-S-oxide reductase MsrA n=1 Tax=Pelagibacterium sp. 26DY04 TaxID=2967130 RepID=UPI002815A6B6|nr:peptide-methionine (S)-S-oxide reductase MsrA [Pelagibacterium sp. 26DY04]WMT85764.1 peptide-methionine (S)-S-oxide reductase MsrA [Pelagibacterium sp. 26DY04]
MRGTLIAFGLAGLSLFAGAPAFADTALFAGGCFWSVESNFDKVEGVTATTSGFAGGHVENPSYEQVVYEDTGHYEVVEIEYDPDVVSFAQLLTVFWHTTDPTDAGGQFCDRGESYRTAIFALDEEQRQTAEASKATLAEKTGLTIVTEIKDAAPFYAAEDYHQNFHVTNPVHYEAYRVGCGRDIRINQLWGEQAFLGTSANPFP